MIATTASAWRGSARSASRMAIDMTGWHVAATAGYLNAGRRLRAHGGTHARAPRRRPLDHHPPAAVLRHRVRHAHERGAAVRRRPVRPLARPPRPGAPG